MYSNLGQTMFTLLWSNYLSLFIHLFKNKVYVFNTQKRKQNKIGATLCNWLGFDDPIPIHHFPQRKSKFNLKFDIYLKSDNPCLRERKHEHESIFQNHFKLLNLARAKIESGSAERELRGAEQGSYSRIMWLICHLSTYAFIKFQPKTTAATSAGIPANNLLLWNKWNHRNFRLYPKRITIARVQQ